MTEAPAHLLLVDDDEVSLLVAEAALQARGFKVTRVTSGEAALEWLSDNRPDAVVLDALMPGIDGFETCRRLREADEFEQLPVLMMTGLDDDASIERAYEAGATDFYVKNRQWSLLAGRLRYLLRAARTVQELERSKARLARAQNLARMGSLDWGLGDRHLQLSVEAQEVLGLPDSVSWPELVALVHATDRRSFLRLGREALAAQATLIIDLRVKLPDGDRKSVV